ncbi:MAG: T9SS type A sorting domain-containing protein [Bacteroidales bacterium]|jgi:hypothetical protein|nr:T9SS type A sorting domain-containing protein [Bacteroidales bacterium]
MKIKLIFATILTIISIGLSAQIIIEPADIMHPGDTFLIHYDTTPEINIDGSMLTDYYWDYTHLTDDSVNYACYAPSEPLEFSSEFPESNFYTYGPGAIYAGPGGGSPTSTSFGYMMFISNENGLFVDGYYSDYGYGYRATYNDPDEILLTTPNHYEDEVSSNSVWTVEINEIPTDQDTTYKGYIQKTLHTDAWGTLECPYGTYDVLRIHEYGVKIDSVFVDAMGVSVYSDEVKRDTVNKYLFWAKEIRHPLVTLYLDNDGNVDRADYLFAAQYAGILDKFNSQQIQLYPNPADNLIEIKNAEFPISILNTQGQVVLQQNENSKLNIQSLSPGIYIIIDANGATEKLIKIKK